MIIEIHVEVNGGWRNEHLSDMLEGMLKKIDLLIDFAEISLNGDDFNTFPSF